MAHVWNLLMLQLLMMKRRRRWLRLQRAGAPVNEFVALTVGTGLLPAAQLRRKLLQPADAHVR